MIPRTNTAQRMLLSIALVGSTALAAVGQAGAKGPARRDCAPVSFEVNYQGKHINAFSALRATGNLSCSTAQAMQRYSITHELYRGFQWRGEQWGWSVYSRANGHTATTMWTARHRQQVWSTTRFAVS